MSNTASVVKLPALSAVAWITLLAFVLDLLLGLFARKAFPWAYVEEPR